MKSTRRDFLQTVGGAIVLSRFGAGCSGDDPDREPDVTYDLTVEWVTTTMAGLKVKLRGYGGMVPGPPLTFRPGDRVQINVDNRLTPYDSRGWSGYHNVPHDLNTTNLHLHGLDVIPHLFEPVGTSEPHADMIAIAPGETKTYIFDIPTDQPAGYYWYHPHHHGSTAVQAVSGMAGEILVLGEIDDPQIIGTSREERLVISDIGLFESEDEADVWTYEPRQNAIWNTFGAAAKNDFVRMYDKSTGTMVARPELKGGFTTGDYRKRFYCVNGVPFFSEDHDPDEPTHPKGTQLPDGQMQGTRRIDMQPGEVLRLRILNACSDLVLPLALDGLALHLIALDGVTFDEMRTMKTVEPPLPADVTTASQWDGVADYNASATSLVLAPGNRAEMLIKAPDTPGTYELVQLQHHGQQFLDADRKVIATLNVSGAPMQMSLPKVLPAARREDPPIRPADIVQTRHIEFAGAFSTDDMQVTLQNPELGIDFSLGIDDLSPAQYDVHTINATVKLGTAEEWHLSAGEHAGGNMEGHPFHIHVNSFQVKSINGIAQPEDTFMDTLWVGGNTSAVVWTRFKQWTGKSVFHCHILPHEDTGMMANILIEPA